MDRLSYRFIPGSAFAGNSSQLKVLKEINMQTLLYKVIKTDTQYNKYCSILETLIDSGKKGKAIQDEIELLTLLIEKYDEDHNTFEDLDPIELLKSLMKSHKMKAIGLAELLSVSEGLVSDMLNYKKGLSKDTVRILSQKFKLKQEAFNRPYDLRGVATIKTKTANPKKRIAAT